MEDMSHNNIGGVLIAVGLCALAGFVAFNVAKMNSKKEKREKKGEEREWRTRERESHHLAFNTRA